MEQDMQPAGFGAPAPRPFGRSTAPKVAYHGQLKSAWALAIKTTFLTVITLGIYRFWAKTRIRRYFWSHVTVADEPLEYAGTGLELFLGFLIAIAIMAPLYGAMSIGELYVADSPAVAIALTFTPLLIIVALIPVAVFRARRYRLSRTLWRGVRAAQTGTTWGYWKRAAGYGLVGWLTLGVLRPLAHARLTSHLMNHTWFGTGRFRFEAKASRLMGRWLLVWVSFLFAVGGYIGAMFGVIYVVRSRAGGQFGGTASDLASVVAAIGPLWLYLGVGGIVLALLCWALAYANYRVFMTRLFAAGTTFDGVRFNSGIRFWRVVGVYFSLGLVYLGLLGGGAVLGLLVHPQYGVVAGVVIAGFLSATLIAPFVIHPLLSHFVDTLTVSGDVDLDAITQNPEAGPRTGEGLASVFDVDAF